MMNCRQVTRLMSDSQERKLTLKERLTLTVHTMICSGCRNFANQMSTIRDLANTYAKGRDINSDENRE